MDDFLIHYNHNHDPRTGQFASSSGSVAAAGSNPNKKKQKNGNGGDSQGQGGEGGGNNGDKSNYAKASSGLRSAKKAVESLTSLERRKNKAKVADKAEKKTRKSISEMSNSELREEINRLRLEQEYKQVMADTIATGKKYRTDFLENFGDVLAAGASAVEVIGQINSIVNDIRQSRQPSVQDRPQMNQQKQQPKPQMNQPNQQPQPKPQMNQPNQQPQPKQQQNVQKQKPTNWNEAGYRWAMSNTRNFVNEPKIRNARWTGPAPASTAKTQFNGTLAGRRFQPTVKTSVNAGKYDSFVQTRLNNGRASSPVNNKSYNEHSPQARTIADQKLRERWRLEENRKIDEIKKKRFSK